MTIKVTLINPAARRFYLAQWDDPVTGLTKTRSTKTTEARKAERFAANLETELNSGTYAPPTQTTWEGFCQRYKSEVSARRKKGTAEKTQSTMNAIDRLVSPKYLAAMADPNTISKFAAELRTEAILVTRRKTARPDGQQKRAAWRSKKAKSREPAPPKNRTEATIDSHLREVRKMMRWAKRMKLIHERPHIEFSAAAGSMKGRAITAEEYDRIFDKITTEIPGQFVENWRHYCEGMWKSGLRIEESMLLDWSDDEHICIDLSHRRPMFRIQAATDKGKKFRLLAMARDFAELILKTPKSERVGPVFNPWTFPPGPSKKGCHRPTHKHVGRVIARICRSAGVMVTKNKSATIHDFRRAFGVRWCRKVLPQVLQEMMRHDDIKTTMTFYVGQLAEDAAEAAWNAGGNTFGNTSPHEGVSNSVLHDETSIKQAHSE